MACRHGWQTEIPEQMRERWHLLFHPIIYNSDFDSLKS